MELIIFDVDGILVYFDKWDSCVFVKIYEFVY